MPPGVNTPLYSTRYPHRNRAWESSRRAHCAVDSQTRFQRGYRALSIDVFTPGGTSEESYYIANRWKERGYQKLLDFGCGLGRHGIYFARQGFCVSAFDLSADGVNTLVGWAKDEGLDISTRICDMLKLPYRDDAFDCIFAYHVISHTDTQGMKVILSEIERVLKPGGEVFLSLCSKDTWSFKEAGYPKIDENTVVKTEDGPEKDIPHFYVTLDDILKLFYKFEIQRIRHVDDCFFAGQKRNSKHYYILAKGCVNYSDVPVPV